MDKSLLKCDFVRYSPQALSLANIKTTQGFFDINRKESATSFKDSCFELEVIVLQKTGAQSVNEYDYYERTTNLGAIALCSTFKLTSSYRKEEKNIDYDHLHARCKTYLQVEKEVMIHHTVPIELRKHVNKN